MVVHGMERLLRRAMPVIVRPTPDERVEFADDLAGGGLPMSTQIVMDGAQMLHHLALLWRRQDHTPIPAHGEPRKSKPSSMWTIRVFVSLSFSPRSSRNVVSVRTTYLSRTSRLGAVTTRSSA